MTLAAAAVAIAVLVGGGTYLLSRFNGPDTGVPPTPAPSPSATPLAAAEADVFRSGRIAVSAIGGIWVLEPGKEPVKLPLDTAPAERCVSISPDGRTVAFLGGGESAQSVRVIDPDGQNPRTVWAGGFNSQVAHQLQWSADGSTVVATKAAGGPLDRRVIVYSVADDKAVVLDWSIGEFPGTFAVSPDGRQIAAIEYSDANKASIAVADVATDTRRTIVPEADIRQIAWSSDGTTIAYLSSPAPNDPLVLHVVAPDGGNDRVIATSDSSTLLAHMAWSPDGTRLAVTRFPAADRGNVSLDIFNSNGDRVGTLGPYTVDPVRAVTWGPNGTAILVTTGRSGIGVSQATTLTPLIVSLDGTFQRLGVPDGYNASCPLGWGTATP
jgi:Tol biopolymer transport system component